MSAEKLYIQEVDGYRFDPETRTVQPYRVAYREASEQEVFDAAAALIEAGGPSDPPDAEPFITPDMQ